MRVARRGERRSGERNESGASGAMRSGPRLEVPMSKHSEDERLTVAALTDYQRKHGRGASTAGLAASLGWTTTTAVAALRRLREKGVVQWSEQKDAAGIIIAAEWRMVDLDAQADRILMRNAMPRGGRYLFSVDNDRLIRLYKKHRSVSAIARELHMGQRLIAQAVKKIRAEHPDLPPLLSEEKPKHSADIIGTPLAKQLVTAYRETGSSTTVGATFGLSAEVVRSVLRSEGCTIAGRPGPRAHNPARGRDGKMVEVMLAPEEIARIVELYRASRSYALVAKQTRKAWRSIRSIIARHAPGLMPEAKHHAHAEEVTDEDVLRAYREHRSQQRAARALHISEERTRVALQRLRSQGHDLLPAIGRPRRAMPVGIDAQEARQIADAYAKHNALLPVAEAFRRSDRTIAQVLDALGVVRR